MRVELTEAKRRQLEYINVEYNSVIKGVTDKAQFGVPEYWEVARDKGDCEDYALAKWEQMEILGWPADAFDIAVCRILSSGEYHAVLVVHTTEADLVMDNRRNPVEKWDDIKDYAWVMTSVGGNLKNWHKVL